MFEILSLKLSLLLLKEIFFSKLFFSRLSGIATEFPLTGEPLTGKPGTENPYVELAEDNSFILLVDELLVLLLLVLSLLLLPEDFLLNHMKNAIRIPMKETLRSLNLSNSVAIVVYEILRQDSFCNLQEISTYVKS